MRIRRMSVVGVLLLVTALAFADDGHMSEVVNPKSESEMPSPLELNPARGQDIGSVFEAFLSPHQQGGEEEDTPRFIPAVFRSTAPSVPRNERTSRGHGVLSFTNDLSKAYVHLAVENVDLDNIVMFHIHCGRPGQLGPIIVDFGQMGDVREFWADGVFSMEITNEDIEAVLDNSEGLIGAFTAGCPIVPSIPNDKVTTIGGMETIAREGELYFNLHTAGQTYFGDIRGKLVQVE
ncbi:MAG: CHRD domain-containing protein [Deinococcota bacterium]